MWKKIEEDEQTPMEKVFDLDANMAAVLTKVVDEIKKEEGERPRFGQDQVIYRDLVGYNLQLLNNSVLRLIVTQTVGGFRSRQMLPRDLNDAADECYKCLTKFEKEVRKRFKEKTGKSIRLSGATASSDYIRVAENGLYRITAIKTATIKTVLD